MAVHHVLSNVVTEVEKDFRLIARTKDHHILAILEDRRRPAVERQDAEFFVVNVDGVTPSAAAVFQGPDLASVALDHGIGPVLVEAAAVDRPAAALTIELESAPL